MGFEGDSKRAGFERERKEEREREEEGGRKKEREKERERARLGHEVWDGRTERRGVYVR
jgi:hypothetical protein